jgi:hypothetical protein
MAPPADYPKDPFYFNLSLNGQGVNHPKKIKKSKTKMSAALSKGFKSKVISA